MFCLKIGSAFFAVLEQLEHCNASPLNKTLTPLVGRFWNHTVAVAGRGVNGYTLQYGGRIAKQKNGSWLERIRWAYTMHIYHILHSHGGGRLLLVVVGGTVVVFTAGGVV